VKLKLDDDNEGWMVKTRASELKKRGWKGSVKEWVEECKKLERDPLSDNDAKRDE
jgi:hypothetical protein